MTTESVLLCMKSNTRCTNQQKGRQPYSNPTYVATLTAGAFQVQASCTDSRAGTSGLWMTAAQAQNTYILLHTPIGKDSSPEDPLPVEQDWEEAQRNKQKK